MTYTANKLRALLADKGCQADVVSRKRDGTFQVKRGYFFTHGMTPDKWGERVARALPPDVKVVSTHDAWAAWPRDSYFVAVVAVVAAEGSAS